MQTHVPYTILDNFKYSGIQASLEAEDLILELADGSGLGVAQGLGGLLHGADHGWRTADEDLDVGGWGGEFLL